MNRGPASAIAVAVFISMIIVPVFLSEDAAGADDIVVSGTVVTGPDHDPVDDVRVYIDGTFYGTTDENGFFEFYADKYLGECSILFEKIGYTVTAYFYDGKIYGGSDDLLINIDDEDIEILNVVMAETFKTITGVVNLRDRPVGNGITVEILYLDTGARYADTTKDGEFFFSCPYGGSYTVYVKHPAYEADALEIASLTDDVEHVFFINEKDATTYLFGLDLTHSLMVLAGIMGLFLMMFVIFYRIHIGKNPGSSKIHSDSKKKDQ